MLSVANQSGLAPFGTTLDITPKKTGAPGWVLTPNPSNPTGFIYSNAGPAGATPWGLYPMNGTYFK